MYTCAGKSVNRHDDCAPARNGAQSLPPQPPPALAGSAPRCVALCAAVCAEPSDLYAESRQRTPSRAPTWVCSALPLCAPEEAEQRPFLKANLVFWLMGATDGYAKRPQRLYRAWRALPVAYPLPDRPSVSKKVDHGIWLVSFVDYDLGHIDLEE